MTEGKGAWGPRLTFLRLEEAVLTQLGQERTAGAGGLEVAQGNVRWVEPVRQMGKACRKWETEEGNMFQPKQHAALEQAPQEHRLLWLSVPRVPGTAAARMHAATYTARGPRWGALLGAPASGTDPPLRVPQLAPCTSAGL